jgi:integrase
VVKVELVKEALQKQKEMMIKEGRFNDRYKTIWKNLLSYFGEMRINNIPKHTVENYYTVRNVKRQSVSREIAMLNASFNYCYNMEYLDVKPRPLNVSHKNKIRNVWLTIDEIKRVFNSKAIKRNPHIEMACKIALTTTARKSAIRNLRVDQINWNEGERGLINFNSNDMLNKAKPRAVIPVPKSIENMLKRCCEQSKLGWVLQTRRGRQISDPLFVLKKAVKDANIEKDVCFHTLRHTGAVHMAMNNVPLLELSRYMGHTSIEITEKVYAKFYPDFMKRSSEVAGDLVNDC